MAIVTMAFPSGVYLPGFDYNPSLGELLDLKGAAVIGATWTTINLKLTNSFVVGLTGTGFAFDGFGQPLGGTLTSLQLRQANGTLMQAVTGLNLSLVDAFDAANVFNSWSLNAWLMSGDDTVNGTNGDDELVAGGTGDDILNGGNGDDFLYGGFGKDTCNGGDGFDTLSFQANDPTMLRGVLLNATTRIVIDPWGNHETFTGIEDFRGSHFSDLLFGSDTDEQFAGMAGRDTIDGKGGADEIRYDHDASQGGGAGVTVDLEGGVATDGFGQKDMLIGIENARGTDFGDLLIGNNVANRLRGLDGKDELNGLGGADDMRGGGGDDIYWVDNVGDRIDEISDSGSGVDTVWSSVTFSLANTSVVFGDVENLDLFGYDAINGTGNASDNIISGNYYSNTLDGGAGNDTLDGSSGDDILIGGEGDDTLIGSRFGFDGDNILIGGEGDDRLYGGDARDILIGGNGADLLNGGEGNDTVSYAGAKAGAKASLASPSINTGVAAGDIYSGIENLIGTDFADTLTGDYGYNTLSGGSGNDVLIGGELSGDTLDGGSGTDTASYVDALAGVLANLLSPADNTGDAKDDTYISIENLFGSGFVDTLVGDDGANLLYGNGGNDTLFGWLGNDTLFGGEGADKLDGGGGSDIASYATAAAVRASLANPSANTGAAAGDTYVSIENLSGSNWADVLTGNSGANLINGGRGNDHLTGGAGADGFMFTTALSASTNVDRIFDFSVTDDTIRLENAIFTALTATGTLASAAFFIGAAAHDADDRIIYDSTTGAVLYDADGTGSGAAVRFATLTGGLALTNADFSVF